jgi:hypothetical protein|tara:strand:+ start:165 stop:935 length:771 start_codon:yes stop_codon:yes gene_type:complete
MFSSELWNKPEESAYEIAFSCRFDRGSSSYLNRTVQSGGNLRKWTFSFWFKMIGSAGFGGNQYYLATSKLSAAYDTMIFDVDSSSRFYYQTAGLADVSGTSFTSTSDWINMVIIYDSDNGTAGDRKRIFVNGTEDTPSSEQTLGQNTDSKFNSNSIHYIGARQDLGGAYFGSYYLAEAHWVDGQAYDPTYFGKSSGGSWVPIDYKTNTGTYGTTGYFLDFAINDDLGNDVSGNNNDWGANGMGTDHRTTDTPTNPS